MDKNISSKPGDYIIIQITSTLFSAIAEVTQEDPLILKVEEEGPYARLKQTGDFIILELDTKQFQADVKNDTNFYLESHDAEGRRPVSGLFSLGVTGGKLRYIHPGK